MNDSMISDSIWKMSDYLSRYYGKKAIIMEFKVISPKKKIFRRNSAKCIKTDQRKVENNGTTAARKEAQTKSQI